MDALKRIGIFFLALAISLLVIAAVSGDSGIRCFEDEVIVWTGNAHDRCIATDNLASLAELDSLVAVAAGCTETQVFLWDGADNACVETDDLGVRR